MSAGFHGLGSGLNIMGWTLWPPPSPQPEADQPSASGAAGAGAVPVVSNGATVAGAAQPARESMTRTTQARMARRRGQAWKSVSVQTLEPGASRLGPPQALFASDGRSRLFIAGRAGAAG